MMKDLQHILKLKELDELDLSEKQQKKLIQNTISLLRLRFQEGYYFSIYTALERASVLLKERYPAAGSEYGRVITAIIIDESDALGELLKYGNVDISKTLEPEEQKIITTLLRDEALTTKEEDSVLKYLLGN
jgi:hypothetical protein